MLLPLGLAGVAGAERAMLRFVRRTAGSRRFTLVFFALHVLMNATTGFAAGVGALRWLTSRRFRRFYHQGTAAQAEAANA